MIDGTDYIADLSDFEGGTAAWDWLTLSVLALVIVVVGGIQLMQWLRRPKP